MLSRVVALRFLAPRLVYSQSSASLFLTPTVCKVKKQDKNKKTSSILHSSAATSTTNVFIKNALSEMNEMEQILQDELVKHLSVQVDLRTYEDIMVKVDNGHEHKMSHLGRVTLKGPHMVMINFADNPSAIKHAKLALQKSLLSVTPQHEGVVLYIPTPRMTRERREQLANDAKGKMFNEYKKALNEIYTKQDKLCGKEMSNNPDGMKLTRAKLLELKRAMEERGQTTIEAKRKQLLHEVA